MHTEGVKRVAVAVRVRPILRSGGSFTHQLERFELEAVTRLNDNQLQVAEQKQSEACRSSCFTFDHIFDQESTQLDLYEEAVVDLVDAAIGGNNATILAYGQTGSGKTFSVLGDVKPNPLENDLLTANSGLFLRVLSDLMDFREKCKGKKHVVVGLSCVEIYNENIRDLFGGRPGDPPPAIRAVMTNDDVYLPALIVKEVTSLQAVFNEIQLAISRRQSRATESNANSSRSHCLFMIDILQQAATAPPPSLSILTQQMSTGKKVTPQASPTTKNLEGGFAGTTLNVPGQAEPVFCSKILLADLAGSEKAQKSGVSGEGLAEATAINSSLTALGNVVHSLHEGGYVSYRTSNLTRLLKPTFSQPASRVLLLAQVSPTQLTFDETISTLHFANKVKAMKVMTTTGAESEKLQFEVIDTQKTYDSLLADLHIWSTDSECSTILRRRYAAQQAGRLFYDAKARRPYKAKERLQAFEGSGVLAASAAERTAALDRRAHEERTRKERTAQEVQRRVEELVGEYRSKIRDARRALGGASKDLSDSALQHITIDSGFSAVRCQVDEEGARASLLLSFMGDLRGALTKELASNEKTLGRLTAAVADARSSGATVVVEEEDATADEQHALSAWFHCSAKRFFYALMELREAQLAILTAKLSVAEILTWKAAAEAKKEKE